MSGDDVLELVPHAARLVGTVRDYGPEDVAMVLADVPGGRMDALAVVLAAMVDPDAKPSELLAWTTAGPTQSRDFDPYRPMAACKTCGAMILATSMGRHMERNHAGPSSERDRLIAAGVNPASADVLAGSSQTGQADS